MRASPPRPGLARAAPAPDAAGHPASPTPGYARAGTPLPRRPSGRAAARPGPPPPPPASGPPPPVPAESTAGSAPLEGPAPAPGPPPISPRSAPRAADPSCLAGPALASFPSVASFLFCWSRGVVAHPRYLRLEAASISTKDRTHSSCARAVNAVAWSESRKGRTPANPWMA